MAGTARFVVIKDGSITLSNEPSETDTTIFFDAPGADRMATPALMFRVNPRLEHGPAVLTVLLNQQPVLNGFSFDTEPNRTFHEVVGAGILQASGNQLDLARGAVDAGTSSIVVSDIVLLYMADVSSRPAARRS